MDLATRLAQGVQLQIGSAAPSPLVQDEDGTAVSLATTWSQKPVLLTFLRHYG